MRIKSWKLKLYFLHKWLSLAFGLPFVLLSISGLIIAFKPKLKTLDVKKPVSLEKVLEHLHIVRAGWEFPRVNYANDYFIIYARKNDVLKLLTVERNSGNVIKEVFSDKDFFFNAQTLHESLFLHESGRMIVGYSGIFLFLVILTGFGFWLKFKFMNQLKGLFIRGSLRRYRDLHLMVGVLVFAPLIFAGITGFLIHYNSLFYSDKTENTFDGSEQCTFSLQMQFLRHADLGSDGVYKSCTLERPYFTVVNERGIKKLSLKFEAIVEILKVDWEKSEYLRAMRFNNLHSGEFLNVWAGPYNLLIGVGLIILNITGILIWLKKQF